MKNKKSLLKSFNEKIPAGIQKTKFVERAKYFALLPVCLLLIASIFILCFGFNLSFDLREQTTFTVSFNTTLSDIEYDKYEEKISDVLENKDLNDYKFERLNEGTSNKLLVKFLNNDLAENEISEKFNAISSEIEKIVINEDATLEISDSALEVGNITKYISNLALFLAIAIVILFVYMWIRFDLLTSISGVIMLLANIAILTSVYAICRLPLDTNVTYNYLFVTVLSLIFFTYMSDRKRQDLTLDETKNLPNSEIVYSTLKNSLPSMLTIVEPLLLTTLVMFIVLICFGSSIGFTMLGFFICTIIALYTSIVIANSFWSLVYNRKNDKRLQARIDRIKKKEQAKELEKNQTEEEKEKIIV